ncbi:MAG: hypothetical protein HY056_01490 [Proteobacteria bacterium]|nr:hypothetical protein [Pseudomonadota bacterium]
MRVRALRFAPASLLALIAIGSLAYAFHMRYRIIEQSAVGIACDTGGETWTCLSRRVVTRFFNLQLFGMVALGGAILNLIRPSLAYFAVSLAAAGLGIVLYNTALSALAVALLVVSFARPRAPAE